jgi:hypothetical protein
MFCLTLLCTVVSVFAQFGVGTPKVAVYVAGGRDAGEYRALSAMMLEAFVGSKRYQAIERADMFMAEVDREQTKQRSGAIDDAQISQLGKQSGVNFVCVVDVTPAFGEYQLSARLIDVETARVTGMTTRDSPLTSLAQLRAAANALVEGVLGGSPTTTPAGGGEQQQYVQQKPQQQPQQQPPEEKKRLPGWGWVLITVGALMILGIIVSAAEG